MRFRILGPLEVVDGDRPVPLGGARQRALLALLLTRANEPVSADGLIDDLWGEEPPRSAANALQFHVSQLRKALGDPAALVTREPGYLLRVGPDDLDLLHFERLVSRARGAPPEVAAGLLREALALWRGPALADLAYEPFLQTEIARLEELRHAALEERFDADLALGRHAQLVGELESLVRAQPLRERLRGQLMLALYRSGRQVEALELYQRTRRELLEELGIEPGPALRELETGILRHDPALAAPEGDPSARPVVSTPPARRAILVVAARDDALDALLDLAEPLARRPERELILARLLAADTDLTAANASLAVRRATLAGRGVSARIAAYTSTEPGSEAVALAADHDVDLLLADAPSELLLSGELGAELTTILDRAPCDVAVLAGEDRRAEGPVATPFGGAENDWSAIELAAWLAAALDTTLRLIGTRADPALGRRDASRLLARASLMVQHVVGIVTEPVLVEAGHEGVLSAAGDARLLVLGLSERWRSEGLGEARLALARSGIVPTLFVRRGLRPSGIAPSETLTRFTWTIASQQRS
jgi:DNA-binding SARP family transcriptional activator